MFRLHCWSVCLVVVLLLTATLDAGGKRLPIPPAPELEKAEKLIEELFAPELAQVKKEPTGKAPLAQTFLQEARETHDYPAGRYALLRRAGELAAAGGDIGLALQAVGEQAMHFQVPRAETLARKITLLQEATRGQDSPKAHQAVIDAALLLLDEALEADDYPSAGRLLAAADAAAIKLRSVPLVSSLRKRSKEIAQMQQTYDQAKPFLDRARKNPADTEASTEAGKYLALVKGNWERGLPLLAKGQDVALRELARRDLDRPTKPAEQSQLALKWQTAAEGMPAHKVPLTLRAYYWYQQAEAGCTGKDREVIRETMRRLMQSLPPEHRIGEITGELRTFTGHEGPVFSAAFRRDARKVVSGGQDGTVRLWDVETGREIRRLEGHTGPVWAVAYSPDGRLIASGSFDSTVRIWDVVSGQEVRRYTGHTDYVRGVLFSTDTKLVLSCGDDRTVQLWEIDSGETLRRMKGHGHYVFGMAVIPSSPLAASASLDRTIRIWDLPDGREIKKLEGHTDTVLSVAATPDGRHLVSASTDKTLRLWDLETQQTVRLFKGHTGYINSVAVAPDGRRILSASQDRTLRLWDLATGTELAQLQGHTDTVWSVQFSRDGRLAISAGHDGTVRLWGAVR